jgi:hypothetical protein
VASEGVAACQRGDALLTHFERPAPFLVGSFIT